MIKTRRFLWRKKTQAEISRDVRPFIELELVHNIKRICSGPNIETHQNLTVRIKHMKKNVPLINDTFGKNSRDLYNKLGSGKISDNRIDPVYQIPGKYGKVISAKPMTLRR